MPRTTQGRLYKRGNRFWLDYTLDGKRFRKALRDPQTKKPITRREKAELERDRILSPYLVKDVVQRRRQAVDALRAAEDVAREIEEAQRDKLTVADAWQAYLNNPSRPDSGPALLADYERRWRRFTDWLAENHPDVTDLEDVSASHAAEFTRHLDSTVEVQTGPDRTEKRKLVSPNRFNKIMQGCRLVVKTLAPQCVNMANPFDSIRGKRLATKGHRELSEGELMAVCGNATGELRVLLAVGLYTAFRLKDACLLTWDEVNLPLNRIVRTPSKTRSRGGKPIIVPLHPVLRAILEETPATKRRGHVLPGLAEDYERDAGSKVCKTLRGHFQTCEIETQERHADQKNATCRVGFHSLRHSFVSMCAAKGVPLPVVQELCGHSSPAIQRHYIHLGPDATQAAIDALPAVEPVGPTKDLPPAQTEPERDELRRLAGILSIERVRELLDAVTTEEGGQ